MQRSSPIPPVRSQGNNIPNEQEKLALLALMNRARALNGWKMRDYTTLEKRLMLWWDVLRQYRIPLEHYKELFDMAFDVRQQKMATGDDVPIEAALLISCWTRPHGLKARIEQRRIEAGRTLPDTAASQCARCLGTGIENVYDIDGRVIGSKAGRQCEHAPIVEGEGLWVRIERDKQAARPQGIVKASGPS